LNDAKAKEPVSVRITQQFRERNNMTYELDCSGTALVLRVFFPAVGVDTTDWRIEACTPHPLPGVSATASAQSRAEAFEAVAERWPLSTPTAAPSLDWSGIARAMRAVHAI
jgi:hypothetical protein